ncbi:MAG: hypothetical protein IT340_23430 [Chloroflexi bacterium]|nr:hypothetical protein [Chloroflexota bacterium]
MLERLSAPQRWIVGGAVLAGIILLAAVALSRDIARQVDAPATAVPVAAPVATPPPRATPIARPPSDDPGAAGRADWRAWLALTLSGLAVVIASGSAVASRRRLAELHRRQTYPVLHCRLGWDAGGDHLVVSVWNAGPGSVMVVRCGLTLPTDPGRGASPLTAYATHPGLEAGQDVAIPFPAVSRAGLAADAGHAIAIVVAWRPATAGSEEIVHRFRHQPGAIRTSAAPAWTDGRLAPHAIGFARDAARLPGEPRPTR